MASLFSTDRRFPVPILAFEKYEIYSRGKESDEEVILAACQVLEECCDILKPSPEDLTYFSGRIQKVAEDYRKQENKNPSIGSKVSFNTSFAKYMQEINLDVMVMKMCNYDYTEAERMYCKLDRDDAIDLVRDYIADRMEFHQVMMEASMYGFGGSYKNDKGKASKTFDLDSDEGFAALKSAGF